MARRSIRQRSAAAYSSNGYSSADQRLDAALLVELQDLRKLSAASSGAGGPGAEEHAHHLTALQQNQIDGHLGISPAAKPMTSTRPYQLMLRMH
jgi:hypothetical protein